MCRAVHRVTNLQDCLLPVICSTCSSVHFLDQQQYGVAFDDIALRTEICKGDGSACSACVSFARALFYPCTLVCLLDNLQHACYMLLPYCQQILLFGDSAMARLLCMHLD